MCLQLVKIARDYGLVVLSRGGTKPQELVYKSDILNQYKVVFGSRVPRCNNARPNNVVYFPFQENIHFALSDMGSDISSTKVRLAIRRNRSVRYLVNDDVIKYILENNLYSAAAT